MADPAAPADVLRPLRRVRQVRQFTEEPIDAATLEALADAARWSGSSRNSQPWRFITIRETATLRNLAEAGMPTTRALATAQAGIAIVLPAEPESKISVAYDEGRAAERILVAASLVGLGAGIAWVSGAGRATASTILGLPDDRLVRTIVALGHPTEAARRPKSARGDARLPRTETVFEERWPAD